MAREEKVVTLENVEIKKITDKAMLVELEDAHGELVEVWIPKSQIKETDCLAEGDEGYMEVTEWIAIQKGLVDEEDD